MSSHKPCFGQSEFELRMLSTHQCYFDSSSLKNTHFKYVEHRSGVQALGSGPGSPLLLLGSYTVHVASLWNGQATHLPGFFSGLNDAVMVGGFHFGHFCS